MNPTQCVKYCNFTKFPGVEVLWKVTVSTELRAIVPKHYGNCAFQQNVYTRKLHEITVYYVVIEINVNVQYVDSPHTLLSLKHFIFLS